MNEQDFHAVRMTGIGGSDAAAVLGLSKWKTPLQVYLEKLGQGGLMLDNEAMAWGRALEPVIRQQYAERTGRIVYLPEAALRHQEHDFMIANLDGYTDDGRVLEVKTARSGQEWGEPGSDEIPTNYLLQVQHYLTVTGFEWADVAVLIGGSDFRIYEIRADKDLQALLIEGEAEFWQRVQDRNPPDPKTAADVMARYGRMSLDQAVEATPSVMASVEALRRVRAEIKSLEQVEEEHKTAVLKALGDSDTLTSAGRTVATWKTAKPSARFDAAAFKDAEPELYSKFIKTGEASRRFLLK